MRVNLLIYIERIRRPTVPPRGLDVMLMIWLEDEPSGEGGDVINMALPRGPIGPSRAKGSAIVTVEGPPGVQETCAARGAACHLVHIIPMF